MPLGISRDLSARPAAPTSVNAGYRVLLMRQSEAEADVRVRVGAGVVVAVAVEHASVGGIVVVATAVGQTLYPIPYGVFYRLLSAILPPMIRPISLSMVDHRLYCLGDMNRRRKERRTYFFNFLLAISSFSRAVFRW